MNAAEITAVCLSVWGITILFGCAFMHGANRETPREFRRLRSGVNE